MNSAKDIADWFLCQIDRDAGDSITHLKVQKLVYYAQAWALVLIGRPLFAEEIEAWAHGPVIPSVYANFREMRWEALPPPDECPKFDTEIEEVLSDVFSVYGKLPAKHLEELTHRETPWITARGGLPPEAASNAIISKKSMTDFYSNMLKEASDEEDTEECYGTP